MDIDGGDEQLSGRLVAGGREKVFGGVAASVNLLGNEEERVMELVGSPNESWRHT